MSDPHGDLAGLLKSWRDRLSPADVGLPAGPNRRAAGLRREELAALAGLSVDYVVRLEQGRSRNPSDQVVASIARVLQLTSEERDHLFVVAGLLPPSRGELPRHIPPGVQRLVARLGATPVAVFTASWELLTWSPLWAALLGNPSTLAAGERNLLRASFGGTLLAGPEGHPVRSASGDPEHLQRSLVADLRGVHGRYPNDQSVRRLVDDLLASSPRFAAMWATGAVSEHQSERKTILHPLVGDIELDCDVFSAAGSDLRIVAYTAAVGSSAADKLDFLRVSAVAAVSALEARPSASAGSGSV